MQLSVNDDIAGLTDVPLKQLRPRHGVLVACIVRGTEIIIPSGDDAIMKNDTVIVVTKDDGTKSIRDII